MDEDVKLLHHMAHEFEEGFNSGDVERIMRFYGDTYVDVNLRNPVQTHAERREYYSQVMRRLAGRIDVTPDEVLVRGDLTLTLPNPHQADIGRDLLARILRQAGINRDAWERA